MAKREGGLLLCSKKVVEKVKAAKFFGALQRTASFPQQKSPI